LIQDNTTKKLYIFLDVVRKYGGKHSEDFHKWYYLIDITIIFLDDSDAFTFIFYKLEGGPFDIFRHYAEKYEMENRLPIYSEFKSQLKKRYEKNQRERDARQKLHSRILSTTSTSTMTSLTRWHH